MNQKCIYGALAIVSIADHEHSGIYLGAGASALRTFRDRSERDFTIATLKRNKGNISQSASDLGVRRTCLHKKEYFL